MDHRNEVITCVELYKPQTVAYRAVAEDTPNHQPETPFNFSSSHIVASFWLVQPPNFVLAKQEWAV